MLCRNDKIKSQPEEEEEEEGDYYSYESEEDDLTSTETSTESTPGGGGNNPGIKKGEAAQGTLNVYSSTLASNSTERPSNPETKTSEAEIREGGTKPAKATSSSSDPSKTRMSSLVFGFLILEMLYVHMYTQDVRGNVYEC